MLELKELGKNVIHVGQLVLFHRLYCHYLFTLFSSPALIFGFEQGMEFAQEYIGMSSTSSLLRSWISFRQTDYPR